MPSTSSPLLTASWKGGKGNFFCVGFVWFYVGTGQKEGMGEKKRLSTMRVFSLPQSFPLFRMQEGEGSNPFISTNNLRNSEGLTGVMGQPFLLLGVLGPNT